MPSGYDLAPYDMSLFGFAFCTLIPKLHACCGFSLTKEVWRVGAIAGRVQISGIGYNTRGRVRGTGKRVRDRVQHRGDRVQHKGSFPYDLLMK